MWLHVELTGFNKHNRVEVHVANQLTHVRRAEEGASGFQSQREGDYDAWAKSGALFISIDWKSFVQINHLPSYC